MNENQYINNQLKIADNDSCTIKHETNASSLNGDRLSLPNDDNICFSDNKFDNDSLKTQKGNFLENSF